MNGEASLLNILINYDTMYHTGAQTRNLKELVLGVTRTKLDDFNNMLPLKLESLIDLYPEIHSFFSNRYREKDYAKLVLEVHKDFGQYANAYTKRIACIRDNIGKYTTYTFKVYKYVVRYDQHIVESWTLAHDLCDIKVVPKPKYVQVFGPAPKEPYLVSEQVTGYIYYVEPDPARPSMLHTNVI